MSSGFGNETTAVSYLVCWYSYTHPLKRPTRILMSHSLQERLYLLIMSHPNSYAGHIQVASAVNAYNITNIININITLWVVLTSISDKPIRIIYVCCV